MADYEQPNTKVADYEQPRESAETVADYEQPVINSNKNSDAKNEDIAEQYNNGE